MGVIGGIGARMLSKMGWTEGSGLGRNRDGRVDPLVHRRRPDSLGIGAEKRPFEDAWWEKMLENAYGTPAKTVDDDALFRASDGRRCRAHGTAKLARLDAHDKAASASKGDGEKGDENGQGQQSKRDKQLKRGRRKKERKMKKLGGVSLPEKGISKKRKMRQKDIRIKTKLDDD